MAACTRAGALLVVLAFATGGCSFGMNVAPSEPSQRTRQAARECSASILAPLGDTLGAGVGAYNMGISLAARNEVTIYTAPVDKGVGLALGISQLALYGAAATYGYIQAGRCNSLRAETHMNGGAEQVVSLPGRSRTSPTAAAASRARGDALGSEHDPGTSTQAASGSVEATLPAWSAFRRVPLKPTPAPRAGGPGGR